MRLSMLAIFLLGLFAPYAGAAEIDVHREVLKNGLVLQVVERHALPMVSVELALHAGARYDVPERAGTASLVAALITEGTQTRTGPDIAEEIEFVGGSLGAGAGPDFATASLTVLTRDIGMGMELLADVVTRPTFPQDELVRVRDETLAAIMSEKDNPATVAAKRFSRELYGDHPYARPEMGDEDSVANITRDDLVRFHDTYYVPNNAVLSIVGDVTVKQARKLAKKALGKWKPGQLAESAPPAPVPPRGTRVVRVDQPLAQASVVMGHLGIARTNPDFYPVVVMNYVLGGGGFASRLVESVRDKQGLAYSVGSGFAALQDPGSFRVVVQTRNDQAGQAMDSILKELRRIRTERVPEEELADAKSYLTGSFPLRMDTNGKMVGLLTFIAMHSLGDGYFTEYVERMRQVTAEDVLRVAKTYLHPDDMLWVVVGNQSEVTLAAP